RGRLGGVGQLAPVQLRQIAGIAPKPNTCRVFLSQFRPVVHSGGLDPASKEERPALRVVPARPLGEEPLTFEQTYRRYARYVAAVVLRLDPGVPDLDDVVQDVFLAAADGLRRLRDRSATKAWLATTAVRMVRRRLRL